MKEVETKDGTIVWKTTEVWNQTAKRSRGATITDKQEQKKVRQLVAQVSNWIGEDACLNIHKKWSITIAQARLLDVGTCLGAESWWFEFEGIYYVLLSSL